ncbi:hypothetical protein OS493_002153 [Desmophyllum pertusum]|uniref:Uncharacterized protein n=1 Tax=Desmophyllum pertusum TaxID=174260 RepID=A0A9W9Z597_9CNID|nr:hypothetical protein OS493_002153 [Desmophyllum pertusum]
MTNFQRLSTSRTCEIWHEVRSGTKRKTLQRQLQENQGIKKDKGRQRFTLDHTTLIQEGIDDETNSQWKKPVEDASEKAVGSNDLTSNAGDNNLAPVELDKLSVGQYVALDKAEWSNRPLIEHVENTAPIP